MEQAIANSRVFPAKDNEVSNKRTGIVMGPGGPSAKVIVNSADLTRTKGPKNTVGPFAVPKAMSSTASATLAVWFKIKGVQLFDLLGLRDLEPLHRQRLRQILWGKQDVFVRRRLRGADPEVHGAVRRHRAPCPWSASTTRRPRPRSAYDKNRDGFVIASGSCRAVGRRRK